MPEPITALSHFGVHTLDDNGDLLSIIAGGYKIVSTDETTTFMSTRGESITFPRDLVDLLIEMLGTHSPSLEDYDDEDDDFTDQEAEERLP